MLPLAFLLQAWPVHKTCIRPFLSHHPAIREAEAERTVGWMEPELRQLLQRQGADGLWRRGPFSPILLCCLLPGKGQKEQLTGREHRKHVREEYMHKQMKTDFKPSMRISITCSRT